MDTTLSGFFSSPIMIRALLAGVCFGISAPLLGQFMIARKLSNIADTISHVALLGIVAGSLTGGYSLLTALCITIAAALGVELLRHQKRIPGDGALVIAMVTSLACVSIIRSKFIISQSLESLLFGSILLIDTQRIVMVAVISVVIILFTWVYRRELLTISLDTQLARLQGIAVVPINTIMSVLTAVFIVAGIRLVGGLMISSLMIVPVLSALQFRYGFGGTRISAIIISILGVCGGLVLSWVYGLPPGSAITLSSVGIFALSFAMTAADQ